MAVEGTTMEGVTGEGVTREGVIDGSTTPPTPASVMAGLVPATHALPPRSGAKT